ncbi:MAG: hypothetical protein ACYTEQ_17675 [Planctomycetota bacterium]
MRNRLFLMSLLVLLLTSARTTAMAAESEPSHIWGHNGNHRHHLAFFLGNTQDGGKHGISTGVDYEYRLDEQFGIGGLLEYAGGDFDALVLGLPLFWHPWEPWRFVVAPGLEIKSSHTEFFIRTGVGYDFKLGGGWSLMPVFNVDWLGGSEHLVYGLNLGYHF